MWRERKKIRNLLSNKDFSSQASRFLFFDFRSVYRLISPAFTLQALEHESWCTDRKPKIVEAREWGCNTVDNTEHSQGKAIFTFHRIHEIIFLHRSLLWSFGTTLAEEPFLNGAQAQKLQLLLSSASAEKDPALWTWQETKEPSHQSLPPYIVKKKIKSELHSTGSCVNSILWCLMHKNS